jgi:hypothetical protein
MKRILALFVALLLVPVVARADLVVHFRFDDDLKDATGQHDGCPVDPKLAPSFAPGCVGSAVVIEKVNAGIELANPSMIDFSLATWVNVGNDYAEMPLLLKGRAKLAAAHNAMMSWGHRRPQPLESRTAEMPDALGVTRTMQVEKWAWLIGLSDAATPVSSNGPAVSPHRPRSPPKAHACKARPTTLNAVPRCSTSKNPSSHSR